MRRSPALRFLLLVAGLWVCARAVLLAPGGWPGQGAAAPAPRARSAPEVAPVAANLAPQPSLQASEPPALRFGASPQAQARAERNPLSPRASAAAAASEPGWLAPGPGLVRERRAAPAIAAGPAPGLSNMPANRWSASAWLLLRRDDAVAVAPSGTLGGSQAGFRLAYRLNRDPARPLALSWRFYAPLRQRTGAEAAFGLDWRPDASLPFHLLAERRQALGRRGRSAFALTFYGGIAGEALPGGLRIDAYGQAGLVGARSRDPFVDGSARISARAGDVEIGGGMWGGAQPGAARLDAGPQLSVRLPLAGETVRVSAEWRFRLAGDAGPDSGPALTVGTDF